MPVYILKQKRTVLIRPTEDCVLESKNVMEDIDLEEGKIRINGKWLTEDEIRYAIKMKISSDDYNVADLAVALRTLIDEMNRSKVLKVRLPKELVEDLESLSKERDESVESLLRRIIMDHVRSSGDTGEGAEGESTDEEPESEVEGEPEEEGYTDIEIGFRSRAAEMVESKITVEAQPIEEVREDVEVVAEDDVLEEEEIELTEKEGDEDIPGGDFEDEMEQSDEVEEEIDIPEEEVADPLALEEEDEVDVEEDESDETGEEIDLAEELEEDVVPDTDTTEHDENGEAAANEHGKDEKGTQKKLLILRRKKILRRRP